MKWALYYAITIVANIVCAIVFHEHWIINAASIGPAFSIAFSVIWAIYLHVEQRGARYKTGFADLTPDEWHRLNICTRDAIMFSIPLFIPFIFFFSAWVKVPASVLVIAEFVGGAFLFYRRHGKEMDARIAAEKDELKKQKELESLGRFK